MLGRYQHPAHFLERNWKYVFSPPPVTSSFLVGAPGAELIWTNCSPMPQRTSVAVTPSTAPTSSDKASGLVMVYPLRDRCSDRASEYCFFASYTSADRKRTRLNSSH